MSQGPQKLLRLSVNLIYMILNTFHSGKFSCMETNNNLRFPSYKANVSMNLLSFSMKISIT